MPSHGQVVLLDDFGSRTLGSIHGQGGWEAQDNTIEVQDHLHANVVVFDGDKALEINPRNRFGDLNASIYTALALPNPVQTGTLYLRWMQTGQITDNAGDPIAQDLTADTIIALNGLATGFDPDGNGFTDIAAPGQATANFANQAALVQLRAKDSGEQFRARNGTAYEDVTSPTSGGLLKDQWYEMWIQFDFTANQQTRYLIAEDGDTPEVVLNGSGGEFWAHRDQTYTEATSAKFFAQRILAAGGIDAGTQVFIDTIGLDSAGFSQNSLADLVGTITGDYNSDGFVSQGDLDLVLLNWGDAVAPAGFDEAALDGGGPFDGLVSQNELDGVLLNWGNGTPPGAAAIPEPTSIILLAMGSIGMATRRRHR